MLDVVYLIEKVARFLDQISIDQLDDDARRLLVNLKDNLLFNSFRNRVPTIKKALKKRKQIENE